MHYYVPYVLYQYMAMTLNIAISLHCMYQYVSMSLHIVCINIWQPLNIAKSLYCMYRYVNMSLHNFLHQNMTKPLNFAISLYLYVVCIDVLLCLYILLVYSIWLFLWTLLVRYKITFTGTHTYTHACMHTYTKNTKKFKICQIKTEQTSQKMKRSIPLNKLMHACTRWWIPCHGLAPTHKRWNAAYHSTN